jgi:hypothetical protein
VEPVLEIAVANKETESYRVGPIGEIIAVANEETVNDQEVEPVREIIAVAIERTENCQEVEPTMKKTFMVPSVVSVFIPE